MALQADANNKGIQGPIPWRALTAASSANGAPAIDLARFSKIWDSEDETGQLHNIVDRFDNAGLVLKTSNMDQQMPQDQGGPSHIDQMAKNATKRAFS